MGSGLPFCADVALASSVASMSGGGDSSPAELPSSSIERQRSPRTPTRRTALRPHLPLRRISWAQNPWNYVVRRVSRSLSSQKWNRDGLDQPRVTSSTSHHAQTSNISTRHDCNTASIHPTSDPNMRQWGPTAPASTQREGRDIRSSNARNHGQRLHPRPQPNREAPRRSRDPHSTRSPKSFSGSRACEH